MNSDLSENLEEIEKLSNTSDSDIKINRNTNKSPHRKTSSPKRDMSPDLLPIFTDELIIEDITERKNENTNETTSSDENKDKDPNDKNLDKESKLTINNIVFQAEEV